MSVIKEYTPKSFPDHVSIQGSSSRWQEKKVAITAANFKAMHTTPVSVLAAPGTGKVLVVEAVLFSMTRTSTAFANGGVVSLQYHTTTSSVPHTGGVAAAVVTTGGAGTAVIALTANTDATGLVVPANEGIDITCASADFITGTGTAVLWIKFRTVTL